MWSSAIASSSPVLTPALTSPRSSSSVRPTTRPAARMDRICSRVLISMPRSLNITPRVLLRDRLQRDEHALAHLVDLADAVHLAQQAALRVDAQQRLGLGRVDVLPVPDDLFGVVRAALGMGPLHHPVDQYVG